MDLLLGQYENAVLNSMDCELTRDRFQNDLLCWSRENLRDFPWREPDRTEFEILIAEILLKQTTADRVDPVYSVFIERYPTAEAVLDADPTEMVELLRPLGLYNQRMDALQDVAESITDDGLPESETELMELPYVGKYAANAILCFGRGQRRPIVDVNVIRIYRRLFDLPDQWHHRSQEIWDFSNWMLPDTEFERYNLALIDFGAKICVPNSPQCQNCFTTDYCMFYTKRRK